MGSNALNITVTRVVQGKVTSYTGKMKAIDILSLYDMKHFEETRLDGYQRELYRERQKEIADYLLNCPLPIIPAILASIREDTLFEQKTDNDQGILIIPRNKGSIILIDGQHRISGFSLILERLGELENQKRLGIEFDSYDIKVSAFQRVLQYEIPILFIDSKKAADILDKEKKPESTRIAQVTADDVESVIFFIVNKTQKGIRPALKDTLQYLIYRAGIRGIPSIEKESWRVDATEIGHKMNSDKGPLEGKINISGARGLGRPVQLNSWVSSMQSLLTNKQFNELSPEAKYKFMKNYWELLHEYFPVEFEDKRNFLILKSIGVYSLNWLASDIYQWITSAGQSLTKESIQIYLSPIRTFNWRSKDPNASILRGMGGKAGVKEAYKILLDHLSQNGVDFALKRYNEILDSEK